MVILWVLLALAGAFIPITWLLRKWWEEELFSPGFSMAGIAAHIIIIVMLTIYQPPLVMVYFVLILLAILINSLINRTKNNKGEVLLAEEDIAKYTRNIARHPENAALHEALADAYVICKRYDEAIAAYQRSIDLDPQNAHLQTAKIRFANIEKTEEEEKLQKTAKWKKFLKYKSLR